MGNAVNILVIGVTVLSLLARGPGSILATELRPGETGPETERRFPPLIIPDGFRATLFACDPLVEYPSVIAIGPRQGTLYVAYDYVTGLGIEIVRRDEVRLVSDTDEDGYGDQSQLYAGGFNSIQGLAYDDGLVFVMHAPRLTALRDTDGDGVADVRQDLFVGLGLPPEDNPNRLHCANGVVVGHDGWLYLAIGDRGCDVRRPEGDRLVLQEGGILRCRPDGRDLHVFASGLRNIYDIALDEELNVFVRDNENDGGDYMIRVCLSFHGADHGYPYLYRERPDEAMPPLLDLGRGSSAGATTYLETAFPIEYRDSLFFCEWGRAVVRYDKQRSGSSFQLKPEVDFAAGSPDDPYGFKPTDLIIDYDGSMLVSDWCDGQRPKRGRGRIYRISGATTSATTIVGGKLAEDAKDDHLIKLLGSPSYHQRRAAQREIQRRVIRERQRAHQHGGRRQTNWADHLRASIERRQLNALGRMHVVWIMARCAGGNTIDDLLEVAQSDTDPRVQVQAVRAVADLIDSENAGHDIARSRRDDRIAVRLASLARDADPRVTLAVRSALGRLHWTGAPAWIAQQKGSDDPALDHAAMKLLRRSNNAGDVLKLLDTLPPVIPSANVKPLALRALAGHADATIVDGIIDRWEHESDSARRREYVDLLSRVCKKPAEWSYWGFRPGPRPANTLVWERTDAIQEILNEALADADNSVRRSALVRMRREGIPIALEALTHWLHTENNTDTVSAILASLTSYPADHVRPVLIQTIASRSRTNQNRLAALDLFINGLNETHEFQLLKLADECDEGPVLAALIAEIGHRPRVDGDPLLLSKLNAQKPQVRAAALEALGRRETAEAAPLVVPQLNDHDLRVRRVAASVAGTLGVRAAVDRLLESAGGEDAELRRVSLIALHQLEENGAIPLAVDALRSPETQLAALNYLADFGSAQLLEPIADAAASSRSVEVLTAVVRVLSGWKRDEQAGRQDHERINRTLAQIHGQTGLPLSWTTMGPINDGNADVIVQNLNRSDKYRAMPTDSGRWQHQIAVGTDGAVDLTPQKGQINHAVWLAASDVVMSQATVAQFLASSEGTLEVWLNGKIVFSRDESESFRPNSDRFEANLAAGNNRLLVRVTSVATGPRFHVRFRRKTSKVEHERLTRFLLDTRGDVDRGRELFANAEKSLCVKCHRLKEQGTTIGPDLTGVGSRFSRIHLIESILEPNRTVAPNYGTTFVILNSGIVLTGVKTAESPESITLGDSEGKLTVISRAEIEELRVDPRSVMPEGFENQLTDREMADLIAFLIFQTNTPIP